MLGHAGAPMTSTTGAHIFDSDYPRPYYCAGRVSAYSCQRRSEAQHVDNCFLSLRLMNDSAGCRASDTHKLRWECLADVQEGHASVMRTPWNKISSVKAQEHMDSLRARLQQLPVSGGAV